MSISHSDTSRSSWRKTLVIGAQIYSDFQLAVGVKCTKHRFTLTLLLLRPLKNGFFKTMDDCKKSCILREKFRREAEVNNCERN